MNDYSNNDDTFLGWGGSTGGWRSHGERWTRACRGRRVEADSAEHIHKVHLYHHHLYVHYPDPLDHHHRLHVHYPDPLDHHWYHHHHLYVHHPDPFNHHWYYHHHLQHPDPLDNYHSFHRDIFMFKLLSLQIIIIIVMLIISHSPFWSFRWLLLSSW